jgi:lipoyl(octanoyl) transferase
MKRSALAVGMRRDRTWRWETADKPVGYEFALHRMDREIEAIAGDRADDLVWLLEHPPIYTAGTSAKAQDLVDPTRLPVFKTGRGGQYTYHGPGQRVAYVMMDLRARGGDVRAFVATLEQWLINTLDVLGIAGERREDRVGVWVRRGAREDKIAALGIRIRGGITFHGVSINVDPDLDNFTGIVPCGVAEHGVTSLADLGAAVTIAQLDTALKSTFDPLFGPTLSETP